MVGGILLGCLIPGDAKSTDPAESASLELLEFLGSWETPEGQWIDPLELMEPRVSSSERVFTTPDQMSGQERRPPSAQPMDNEPSPSDPSPTEASSTPRKDFQ
ncbi:MAG: hypothetical protein D6704_02995 [Nitrospirae bacterium]|nr:MAG: hypothetical protein D6704_02995 [Nitrospirota bacterium]